MPRHRKIAKEKNSRERILEGATHLFGRRGYHGTTIDDITRYAGISRGALYWHFKGKSDVLGAVVELLKKNYLDRFTTAVEAAGPDPIDKLWCTFKFNAAFAIEHTDIVHCLRNLSLELSPAEGRNMKAFFSILNKQHEFIVGLIREAQSEKEIRADIRARMLAAIILAIHDGILLQWTAFKDELDGRELVWSFRQVMLAGMAEGAKVIHPKGARDTCEKVKVKDTRGPK